MEKPSLAETPDEAVDLAHSEAATINDEIEARKRLPESSEKANSELADLALLERSEFIGSTFETNPEVWEKIKRTYRREALDSGVVVYVDPEIGSEDKEDLSVFLDYLREQKYEKDFVVMNSLLLEKYQRASRDKIPPVFIHGNENFSSLLGRGAPDLYAGFANQEMSNINISGSTQDFDSTFLHELIHNLENHQRLHGKSMGYPYKESFKEGFTSMVENKIVGIDLTDSFIRRIKRLLEKAPSDHPLADAIGPDGKTFRIKLETVIDSSAQRPRSKESDPQWPLMTKYSFTASFLDWYRTHKDPSLSIMKHGGGNNYDKLGPIVTDCYRPTFEEGEMVFPAGSVEMNFLRSELCTIGLPNNHPILVKTLEEIQTIKDGSDENKKEMIKEKLLELLEAAKGIVIETEESYNTFLSEKLAEIPTL